MTFTVSSTSKSSAAGKGTVSGSQLIIVLCLVAAVLTLWQPMWVAELSGGLVALTPALVILLGYLSLRLMVQRQHWLRDTFDAVVALGCIIVFLHTYADGTVWSQVLLFLLFWACGYAVFRLRLSPVFMMVCCFGAGLLLL